MSELQASTRELQAACQQLEASGAPLVREREQAVQHRAAERAKAQVRGACFFRDQRLRMKIRSFC